MNSKKIMSLSIFLMMFSLTYAQHKISGKIQENETNFPLAGASVYIEELKKNTFTDIEGNYEFPSIKPGNYLIEISAFGYKTITQEIHLTEDKTLNFHLKSSVTELSEVVITGVTRSTQRKQSPIIIKSVDNDFLKQSSSSNLIEGLKTIPGISQLSTGPSISKPMVRGLGFNRVLTLNNGIRQEGQQWGDEHGIEIDEYTVDKIEIIKGPGSLAYGSDGIAGVLNFLPPRALPEGKIKTQLISNYQTNHKLIGSSLINSGTKNDFQWLAQISNKYAADYHNKYDGKVFNSGFKELNGKLFLGLNKSWGHTHFTFNSFNTNLGIIEGERDDLGRFTYEDKEGNEIPASKKDYGYSINFPHQKINHFSLASNSYFKLNHGNIKANLGFQNNRRKEFEDPTSPQTPDLYLQLNTFTYNFRYNFEKINNWETSIGISGMQQNNQNKGEEFLIPDYNLWDIGGFIFTQKSFDNLSIAGGIRFDNRFLDAKELFLYEDNPVSSDFPDAEEKFSAIKKSFNGFSGSIGISYRPTEVSTFKLNLSRGYRAPNIAELASNGIHEGTFRYEIGNPDLKSEYSNQIDLGYYLHTEHVTFEITPFLNFMENYIFIQRLENHPINEENISTYEFTSGNATLYGGEFYLDFHPHPLDWLHIANSFSFVQGIQNKRIEEEKYLPSIPAPKYRGEAKTELKNINKNLSNTYLKFAVDHYFKQDKIFSAYDTETSTPAYTLLSFGIGTSIKAFDKKDFINLYISGENLTNIGYQDHLNRLKYAPENQKTGRKGVFNMGRNFSIKMVLNI